MVVRATRGIRKIVKNNTLIVVNMVTIRVLFFINRAAFIYQTIFRKWMPVRRFAAFL